MGGWNREIEACVQLDGRNKTCRGIKKVHTVNKTARRGKIIVSHTISSHLQK